MMHWWYGGALGVGRYVLMALSMTVFWGVIVVLAIAFIRALSRNQSKGGMTAQHRSPEEILAERFARGEISEKEYQERLVILHGRFHSSTSG